MMFSNETEAVLMGSRSGSRSGMALVTYTPVAGALSAVLVEVKVGQRGSGLCLAHGVARGGPNKVRRRVTCLVNRAKMVPGHEHRKVIGAEQYGVA